MFNIFYISDNLDILSLLFKLLTKTLITHGSEPDDTLLGKNLS